MLDFNSTFGYALLIIIGFNIGILSGFFGIGGCFMLTPLLNILGLPMTNAIGTGLLFSIIVSLYGSLKHFFLGNAIVKISLIVGFFAMIGVQASQPIILYLDFLHEADFYVRLVYIVLLIGFGAMTLRKKQDIQKSLHTNSSDIITKVRHFPPLIKYGNNRSISLYALILVALFVGFIQGFLGVGGGFILVPIFIIILDMKSHHAVGTSLLTILISSSFASYLYMQSGKVIFTIAGLLGIGAFFGVNLGVKMIANIDSLRLKTLFSIFLLLSSLGIILKAIHFDLISIAYSLILCFSVTLFIILKYGFRTKLIE